MGLDLAEPLPALDAVTDPILLLAETPLAAGLRGHEVVRAHGRAAAVRALLERRFACVVLDFDPELLAEVRTAALDVPVIALTAADDDALAVEAVRLGAQDVLHTARADGPALSRAIALAVERKRVEARLTHQAL